jgi:hypothetical protein
MEKASRVIRPCRHGKIPAAGQIFTHRAKHCVIAIIGDTGRFISDHRLSPLPVSVKLVKKFT